MTAREVRERFAALYARTEEAYDTHLRPAVPGAPPFWLFSLVVAVGTVVFLWGLMFMLLGGWGALARMVNFLSEATRVYEPSP